MNNNSTKVAASLLLFPSSEHHEVIKKLAEMHSTSMDEILTILLTYSIDAYEGGVLDVSKLLNDHWFGIH